MRARGKRGLAGLAVLSLLFLASCQTLPDDLPAAPAQQALPSAPEGPLAEVARATQARVGSGRSGFLLIGQNAESLRWRLALIDSATTSLDLQYYLWYGDASGTLLLRAILRTADRGVRVRLLVDDIALFGKDEALAAIDVHPNVELRIFNPWHMRENAGGRLVGFLARSEQLNRRMHNKLTVADNRVAICGGRNLGDQYFGLSEGSNFHDLDVLAVGPVVHELSEAFDVFWNAEPVVIGGQLVDSVDDDRLVAHRKRLDDRVESSARLTGFPLERRDWSDRLDGLPSRLHAGTGHAVYDRPGEGAVADGSSVAGLGKAVDGARFELIFENAYWVPNQNSVDQLRAVAERGVQVRILTNSLSSHDVPAVNSEYKKWRQQVLETGTELHELRHDAAIKALQDTPPVSSEYIGLHTKAFVVDRDIAYIGSHNLDPRSHVINTELGLLVKSPGLAGELAEMIERDMGEENSWRVALDEDGDVVWIAEEVQLTRQPARNGWQRVLDGFFGILPLRDQL
jgi:putative cardiolipin synthase